MAAAPAVPQRNTAKSCATTPFIVKANSPKLFGTVEIWYSPLIVLSIKEYSAGVWLLSAGVRDNNGNPYPSGEELVNIMFQTNFIVDGEAVEIRQEECSLDDCEILFPNSAKAGTTVEGRLVMNKTSPLAANLEGLLSEGGMQSADVMLLTKDGPPVRCHKLLLQVREETQWPIIFSIKPPKMTEDGSMILVSALEEFPHAAVEHYRNLVYTGDINVSKGDLSWENPGTSCLADIALKIGEEELLDMLSSIQTVATNPARAAFQKWYAEGKGDFEELHLVARRRDDKERLKEVRDAKEAMKEKKKARI